MRWWNELKFLVRKLNRRRAEQELEKEIQANLELETQEQRDAILEQEDAGKPFEPRKVRYITRLSNSTTPAPTA
jgi:hypothetical protein